MSHYFFIDPGNSTGWAKFDADSGEQLDAGTERGFDNFCEWMIFNISPISNTHIKKIVVENFALYPWKSQDQMWSEFETVQVIGAIRAQCYVLGIDYEKVPANNKNMGFMYMGIKEPPHSNPLNHQMVAAAHGIYYLQTRGIRKPKAR